MKKKLLLLLTMTAITATFFGCGNDSKTSNTNDKSEETEIEETTQEDHDIITQIEDYEFSISGFTVNTGFPDGREVSFLGNLTDYTILSETKEQVSIEGKIANKGITTKDALIIDFNINENGILVDLQIDPEPELKAVLPLSADLILTMDLIGAIYHQEGEKIIVDENGDITSDWYTEEILINKDTISSVRFSQEGDYKQYNKPLGGELNYRSGVVFTLTDGREYRSSVGLNYYHDFDNINSPKDPKWTNDDHKLKLSKMNK